jgi:NOL1/NOP2/sun family putative RNA methylase
LTKVPALLLSNLQDIPAFNEAAFIGAHQRAAVTSIRLHSVKGANNFDSQHSVPWCPEGRYLDARPVFTLDPAYHAGAYYVQEASSMFLDYMVRQLCPDRSGLRVLDLCAAPGGKSTLLASALEDTALLISNEVIRSRATILAENATRWGYTNHWVTANDPRDFSKLTGYFDIIVVDAPCSGSGLFRKDARAVAEWSENNVQLCSQRQQRIIADAWPALKEGGLLIYATCSYSAQEDEEILDWIGETYEAETEAVTVPAAWGIVKTESERKSFAGYRFFPDRVKGEGFFIAAVRKTGDEPQAKMPRFKTAHDGKAAAQSAHLLNRSDLISIQKEDSYYAMLPMHEADYQYLRQGLYFRKTGLQLGSPTAKEWLPAHDVALSIDRSVDMPEIALTTEQSLRFLKKEDFGYSGAARGWQLVTYEGLGLGWVKALGNRVNNYLPKHWRIRMELPDEDWV